MLHIFQLTYIYCINKLVTCETTLKMKHLIFLLKNVTTWRQMLSVFCFFFKHLTIPSNTFLTTKTNQNEKKIALPSLVCHGLPENAFQVNQLFNVTWSIVHLPDPCAPSLTSFISGYLFFQYCTNAYSVC